jgi:hypothetical protein
LPVSFSTIDARVTASCLLSIGQASALRLAHSSSSVFVIAACIRSTTSSRASPACQS